MKRTIGGCLLAAGGIALLMMLLFVSLVAAILGAVGFGSGGEPSCTAIPTPPLSVRHGGANMSDRVAPQPPPQGTPGCVPSNEIAAEVVALARQMADALYVNPSCEGIISYPDCYYTWYNASFPSPVIAYGNQVCPGCSAWANGTYQCVSFVRGAYGPIYPMVWTANAFDLYALYAGKPGWQEIPSAAAPPGERGLPLPGDVMVFKDSSVGHVAIVMNVMPPTNEQNGSITFANANSVSPYTTMSLLSDLSVDTSSWPGYTVWGYLRPAPSSVPTSS